jgi:putative phage-type endonuclease
VTESLIQRSQEWLQARCGSLGASALHEALAKTKSGWSASRANCMARLVLERVTGNPVETYQNAAMLHGIETEPEARAAYSFRTGNDVAEVGLLRHPEIAGTHASPDGLVGGDGLVEIKCPQPGSHLATLLGEAIPEKYVLQVQWQMRCSGRQWCDFVSYSPAFPESMRLFIHRFKFDAPLVAGLEADVRQFLTEVDAKVEALRSKYLARAA